MANLCHAAARSTNQDYELRVGLESLHVQVLSLESTGNDRWLLKTANSPRGLRPALEQLGCTQIAIEFTMELTHLDVRFVYA